MNACITNETALNFFISQTPLVIEHCEPLNKIGVQFFSYSQISKENTLLYLSNDEKYTKYKFSKKLFGGYDYVHKAVNEGVTVLLFLTPNENDQTDARRALLKFGYNVGIDFYTTYNNYCEIFHFSGRDDLSPLIECCKNHQWVFRRFIQFFKNQMAKTLYDETTPRYIFRMDPRPNELVCRSQSSQNQNLENVLQRIKEQIQFHKVYLPLLDIHTAKEYEILEMLIEGHPIKGIAIKLEMSYRTVEDYVQRIKIKVGVQTVRELYKRYRYLF